MRTGYSKAPNVHHRRMSEVESRVVTVRKEDLREELGSPWLFHLLDCTCYPSFACVTYEEHFWASEIQVLKKEIFY